MTLETTRLLPTKKYSFEELRDYLSLLVSYKSGVFSPIDFKVSQHSTPNLSVDIESGKALVTGTTHANQGMYAQSKSGIDNVAVANPEANPRIDAIVLVINDSTVLGSTDTAKLEAVAGKAKAGATIGNLEGAPTETEIKAKFPNFLILAYVEVKVSATKIENSNIRDFRKIHGTPLGGALSANNPSAINGQTVYAKRNEFMQIGAENCTVVLPPVESGATFSILLYVSSVCTIKSFGAGENIWIPNQTVAGTVLIGPYATTHFLSDGGQWFASGPGFPPQAANIPNAAGTKLAVRPNGVVRWLGRRSWSVNVAGEASYNLKLQRNGATVAETGNQILLDWNRNTGNVLFEIEYLDTAGGYNEYRPIIEGFGTSITFTGGATDLFTVI